MKQSIYIETSVISYLASRASRDIVTAARQQITQEWWETKRAEYNLFISSVVLDEVASGDPSAANRRLGVAQGLALLSVTDEALDFARFLVKEVPFPPNAVLDASHIAVAATQKMDYILTWNFKHIANAAIRSKLEVLAHSRKVNLPVIGTPEELLF